MQVYRLPWRSIWGTACFTAILVWGASSPIARAESLPQTFPPTSLLPSPTAEFDPWVERVLRKMTLEEKVGQLLMVGFSGTEINPTVVRWVKERHVGGVALFARNIVHRKQTARLTRELQGLTRKGVPLFIALDQEGGQVVRVKDGATLLPGNMALGATRDPSLAYAAGQALGFDLRMLGFNMNFAPVLDVNSNPRNPVIGVRSYGERAELVGLLGGWYLRGQQEMGVIGVAKHFPGHGDTQTDSHFAMPIVQIDMPHLESTALEPFRQAMYSGLDAIMTAHIALPRVAGSGNLPATVSKPILTGLLRKHMGFDGIVLTDGLEMQAIAKKGKVGRAAVAAILAGADMPMIVWSPKHKEDVYRALLRAAKRGEISKARLNRSVRRILWVKAKHQVLVPAGKKKRVHDVLTQPYALLAHQQQAQHVPTQVADRIARQAITLVRNEGHLLPLTDDRYDRVVVIAPNGALAKRLRQESHLQVFTMPSRLERHQRNAIAREIAQKAAQAEALVLVVANGYHVDIARLVTGLVPGLPTVLVSMASPYYLTQVPNVQGYVCSYSDTESAQRALANALIGAAPMPGRLPVSIPGMYAYDHEWQETAALGRVVTP